MKYLKYFEEASAYEAYKNGSDYVLPNVSYVEELKGVKFNPVAPLVYNMVDLGLPSGLLWADRNVGASSPEDAGLYFAWGDTVGYTAEQIANGEKMFSSDWSDYFDTTDGGSIFNKYNNDGLTVLEGSDDAVTINMGSEYRMPTNDEMQELINNCTLTFIDLQDNEFSKSEAQRGAISEYNLKGVKFTGSNGNSIFISASGNCSNSILDKVYRGGYLWSSSLFSNYVGYAYYLNFNSSGYFYVSSNSRYCGYHARGVCNK